ncbi:hypothetical protein QVD17_37624 [Tagetes erecta]|uniref:DDE Tnp4 domain-containing protein n=1 Tax=Tagetes erecta TaxID=13708 RepID=A0AAD8JUD0_TARER|nr:hypothetical protein QVD17_37624 [Tagetes erecta]
MSSSSSQLYNRLLNDDDDTSSDEYEEEMAVKSAMSFVVRGLFEETENTTNPIRKEVSLERDRAKANENLMKDYFVESLTYPDPNTFRRRFRMSKRLFLRIVNDLERCFGVLQQQWHIIQHPCRLWIKDKNRDVMYACIILNNMILEDDDNGICQNYIPDQIEEEITQATFEERVANDAYLRNKHEHYALMTNLIEHA